MAGKAATGALAMAALLLAAQMAPARAEQPPTALEPAAPLHYQVIRDFLEQSGIAQARALELYRGLGQVGPVQPDSAERPGCTDYAVEPQEIAAADPAAARIPLEIRSSGSTAPWQVSATVPWITVASAAGSGRGEAVLNLEANEEPLPREGEIALVCGGEAVRTVPVRQPAAG